MFLKKSLQMQIINYLNYQIFYLSPHNAALTLECRKRMAVEGAENIIKYLKNKNAKFEQYCE